MSYRENLIHTVFSIGTINVSCRENIRANLFSLATIVFLVGCCSCKTSDQKVFKPYEYHAKPQVGPRVIIVRPRE